MTLSQGRSYLAIPGPSVLPYRILASMQRPSPNIYVGALVEMVTGLWPDLRALAGTQGHVASYICNGHGAWAAVNSNLFSRGDRALVLVTGVFAHGWAGTARGLWVEVQVLEFGGAAAVDPAKVEQGLRADPSIKAVLMTHVDTASSVKSDVQAVRAAMDAAGHSVLLAVDCVASLGCDEFLMDAWGVDVMLGASQKGLMCPMGMAFVWFNDNVRDRCLGSNLRMPYWDWTLRVNPEEFWHYWFGTAPTAHLYALRESLTMILHEEGLP